MITKTPSPTVKKTKRRTNMLYKLRKKGVRCNTRERCIFIPYKEDPWEIVQVRRLCSEFNFNVQLIIE